jgi:hypothetical protein
VDQATQRVLDRPDHRLLSEGCPSLCPDLPVVEIELEKKSIYHLKHRKSDINLSLFPPLFSSLPFLPFSLPFSLRL